MFSPATRGFWSQLQKRKLVQWGLLYVGIAWGLLQGIGFIADAFAWPALVKATATLILANLLPVVLVLAWYHGEHGSQRVAPVELAWLALIVIGGGALIWRYVAAERWEGFRAGPQTSSRSQQSQRPSIAVLRFDNRSGVAEDEQFVAGVHDDILKHLTKFGAMNVIARSSLEAVEGTPLSTAAMADELGATHLVDGGVQRAGDRVRVQVRLVDAHDGTQVWAESYDRVLSATNLFGIQSEIATRIAESLAAELTPSERERVRAQPTSSLAAWELYQYGERRLEQRTPAALREAIEHFRRAVELDPGFALAYAGLANATWLEADYAGKPVVPAEAEAARYLERALELDPQLPAALATKAKFLQMAGKLDEAERLYRRAIELQPSDPNIHTWYAQLLDQQDRDAEAQASMERAVASDPLSIFTLTNSAFGLAGLGRFEESDRRFAYAQRMHPQSPRPYLGRGVIQMYAHGRLDQAVPLLREAVRLGDSDSTLGQALLDLGDERTARELLADRPEGTASLPILADAALLMHDRTAALRHAGTALAADPQDLRALALLRDEDLRKGRHVDSVLRYVKAFPELALQESPRVDGRNYAAAIDLAVVMLATGESARAKVLLQAAERTLQRELRLGPWGYGIQDARIHALRGRPNEALLAMETAVREGWRVPNWRYFRDADPALDPIRRETRFRNAFTTIERDLDEQAARLGIAPKQSTPR
jgi:TolB-like protein/Flp pilus assembly protein TadD